MTARSELEREILAVLVDDAPLYVVDLAAAVDEHPLTVENACDRLQENGAVRSIGCRRYGLTAAGRRRLTDADRPTRGSGGRSRREGRT